MISLVKAGILNIKDLEYIKAKDILCFDLLKTIEKDGQKEASMRSFNIAAKGVGKQISESDFRKKFHC